MPTLKFTGFQGVIPKVAPRLLPDNAAQEANNVKVSSGELHSYNASVLAYESGKTKPELAAYRAVHDTSSEWLTWSTDVDVVRAPFDVSVEPRFCWTGDVEPKYGTYSDVTSGSGDSNPATYYSLGVPNPQTAPAVSHAGGVGTAVSRYYAYTFVSALAEESGPSPVSAIAVGKVDGTWTIASLDRAPANSRNGSAVYDSATSTTTFTDSAAALHWLRTGETVVMDSTDYTVTTTPTASTFTVVGNASAATSWARKTAWNTTGLTKRIYRSSGSAAALQLVVEDLAESTTSWADTTADASIPGDDLVSDGWQPPPVGLRGLTVAPSGSLVGFVDNLLCQSVPFQPHAWRDADQRGADYDIVAIGIAGNDIVAATSANPYVATGMDPETTVMTKIKGVFPCLSKRSMCSDGAACFFSSRLGIVGVTGGEASVVTTPWYTADEWQDVVPSTHVSAFAEGKLFVAYQDVSSVRRMLAFNLDVAQLTTMDVAAWELYVDETSGEFYITTMDGIEEFDGSTGAPLIISYQTKEVVLAKPTNFGAAQVVFSAGITQAQLDAILAAQGVAEAANAVLIAAGNLSGAFGHRRFAQDPFAGSSAETVPATPAYSSLTFELYSRGSLVFSKVVNSINGFRLPAGFKTDRISVKVSGQSDIAYIVLAETMAGLGAA